MFDAKKTLRFVEEHFDDIKSIYKLHKKNGILDFHDIEIVFIHSGVIDNLIEYKIIEERFDGNYTFNENYADFISFLLDDFALDMPEQIKKYYNSLSDLYEKLRVTKGNDKNTVISILNGLESEIRNFEKQLQKNISKLIKETKYIKANNDKLDYTEKVKKVSELTSVHVEPLNTILAEHSDSIYTIINNILEKANTERYTNQDRYIKQHYQKLYTIYSLIRTDISKKNRLLIDEVIPLLDRIKTESLILTGFINFLDNNKQYNVPNLIDRQRFNTYSNDSELDAKNVWEGYLLVEDEIIFEDIRTVEDSWLYNKEKYYNLLLLSLPNDDFYSWIFETLNNELGEVDLKKFFDLSKLIFQEELKIIYSNKKNKLVLLDKIISVPLVSIRK